MAVPKRKTSKARRDKRRSSVWKISLPDLQKCSQCGELKLRHRVCEACGYYDGKEVLRDGKVVTAAMLAEDAAKKKKKTDKAEAAPKTKAVKTEKAAEETKPAAKKKTTAKKAESSADSSEVKTTRKRTVKKAQEAPADNSAEQK